MPGDTLDLKRKVLYSAACCCTLLTLPRCNRDTFREPLELGGKLVPAETLNRGQVLFRRHCAGCHGRKGDGNGPSAASMTPRPRNFTRGQFKYKSVVGDALPLDGDLLSTVREGLQGTHMPAWSNLSEADLSDTVQYIKTFSPRWRQEQTGRPIPTPADPWGAGDRDAAIERGERVYHAQAKCWECHPAYRPRQTIQDWLRQAQTAGGDPAGTAPPIRPDVHRSAEVTTLFGQLTAPDFLEDTLRVRRKRLYRTIAAGVGGTPMPTWSNRLQARELWAVVHYVKQLVRFKGTPRAAELRATVAQGETASKHKDEPR
jgi:mono/diheme cytochrome c family protein